MVGRGVLRFKKGVCSKRVSGSVVLEAFSSRARFICTTVVQIGVAVGRVSCETKNEMRMNLAECRTSQEESDSIVCLQIVLDCCTRGMS